MISILGHIVHHYLSQSQRSMKNNSSTNGGASSGDHIVCPDGAEQKSPDWQRSDTSGSEKSILNEKVLGPISNEMPTKRPHRWEKQIARS